LSGLRETQHTSSKSHLELCCVAGGRAWRGVSTFMSGHRDRVRTSEKDMACDCGSKRNGRSTPIISQGTTATQWGESQTIYACPRDSVSNTKKKETHEARKVGKIGLYRNEISHTNIRGKKERTPFVTRR